MNVPCQYKEYYLLFIYFRKKFRITLRARTTEDALSNSLSVTACVFLARNYTLWRARYTIKKLSLILVPLQDPDNGNWQRSSSLTLNRHIWLLIHQPSSNSYYRSIFPLGFFLLSSPFIYYHSHQLDCCHMFVIFNFYNVQRNSGLNNLNMPKREYLVITFSNFSPVLIFTFINFSWSVRD